MPKDDTTIEDSTVNLYELYDKDPDVAAASLKVQALPQWAP